MSKQCNQRVVDSDVVKKFPKIQEDEPVLIFFGKFLYTKGLKFVLFVLFFKIKKNECFMLLCIFITSF